ncbi:MAG: aminotransferase class V-fold PLP-dependent enzyme [Acidobacteriota bacterium]|nr:aminotransferase class V-fold PLP-dependent enzyme [Acidobacteriota bacterium]
MHARPPAAVLVPQRDLFDIPDDVAYFNCAYYAPLLNRSRDRFVAAAAAKSHPWERTASDFFTDGHELRRLAAATLGGDADGYAIVPAASYGIAVAAQALRRRISSRDRILVLDEQFPSNYYAWRRLAGEAGAQVDVVPKPADCDWTPAVLARLGRGVRIVALPHCHWTDGALLDLPAIGRACRDLDASLVVDATQSLGALPLPFEEVRPDFVVAAGYKWLLWPYGVGLLYVAPGWRTARPLEESWLARLDPEDFAGLTRYRDDYLPSARRFDVGETGTAALPAAIAALEQLRDWGVDAVAATLRGITDRIARFLEARGFQVADARLRSPHLFGAVAPSSVPRDAVGRLRDAKVFVSQRGTSLRFSPHVYVTEADVSRLFQAIENL